MSYTVDEWINGYGGGITGPTTPTTSGPTVYESLEYSAWVEKGGKYPVDKHTVVSCAGKTIAIVPTFYPEGEANARLIAAAPDLLNACELTERAWCGDGVDMATAVDACLLAIAKAIKK